MPIKLPRKHLQLKECEKFKALLLEAITKGSTTVEPKAAMNLSVGTFMARFGDARTGYTRFKYPFPLPHHMIGSLKAFEMSDGTVLIEMTGHDEKNPAVTGSKLDEINKEIEQLRLTNQAGSARWQELAEQQEKELEKVMRGETKV